MGIERDLRLRPGDRIIVPKSGLNVIQHHGIYSGQDKNGQHWFLENHHTEGVRYIASEQFFLGVPADRIQVHYFSGNDYRRLLAVNHAKSMLGKPYNLFLYNCEHYSNEVQYGKPESGQVVAGLLLAGLFAVFFGTLTYD